ncbi:TonB-dependent receptor [Gramella sp. KN1008]|uniref:TonB-dependent receptor n=1 Tax=Gramella sp. KN1008 TaxID=2529298 RepID=UPI00104003E5|nr:TonB-dependent receptor [Gramella sp. KN1008]TBW27091.1 TonB-dependent receptor [Gramella sp. KN1008]
MNRFTGFLLLLFTGLSMAAQEEATISGVVTDEKSFPLASVNVKVENSNLGTITDLDGEYSLQLNSGTYSIRFSAIGYKTQTKSVTVSPTQKIDLSVTLQEDLQSLGEIVITSNRRRETLDEVPSSVSVLTSSQIEELSQTSINVADVITEIPGIALSTNRTSSTGQTLRGRNMLVLIDGIPQSTPLRSGGRDINTIDPNTIERIEVIKGATAIYGNGADGGIINYITKQPEKAEKLQSTTELGTMGSLVNIEHTIGSRISQTFSGQLDKLGYVINGNFQQTGLFRDANGEVVSPTYGLGETNQYSLFGKLNYQFTPDQSLELMYNYYSSNQDTEYINQAGVYGERPAIGVIGEVIGVDQGNRHNHNAQVTYDSNNLIGGTDLRVNMYMQDFQTVYGFSPYFYNAEEGYDGGQSTIESTKQGLRINLKSPYSLGELNGDLLYGVDILNDKTSQKLVDGRIWAPEMDMTNFAPYAQLKTLYREFVLKAGLRFENIKIGVPDYQTIYLFPYGGDTSSGGTSVNGGELSYDATTFNLGLRYNKWDIFKPFVSFSQSFSIADLGRTLRTATENTLSQISSEAVIANNYEAGFNSRIGNTYFSGAYFISTSDLGATYREVNGIFQIARQPEKVYGFEFAVDSRLSQNFKLGSSISYTEGKLDSQDNGNYDTYMNGDRIPPLKVVSYLSYRPLDDWSLRLSHIYSGNRDHFEPNAEGDYTYGQGPVNSFNLVNLTSSYKLNKNTSLGLGIENLLNEDYYNPISQWAARDSDYIKANGTRFNLSLKVKL